MDDLCTAIECIGQRFKNAVIWIRGDFKLLGINWNRNTIDGNQNSIHVNNRFKDVIQNCSLEQKVTFPARQESTLDLFLTNRPSLVNRCTSLPGIGDHDIVYIELSVTAKRSKPVKRKIFLWKKADTSKLKEEELTFQMHFLEKYSLTSSVQDKWDDIKSNLMRAIDACVPSKMSSTRHN